MDNEEKELVIQAESSLVSTAMTRTEKVDLIVEQNKMIIEVMAGVMKKGIDYGTIPGCGKKPTLLKPGAEKLIFAMGLRLKETITRSELDNGHREWEIVVHVNSRDDEYLGFGVGLCTTMESKFRYKWKNGNREELTDIADKYNTVLKIAKKRAMVDAVLSITAASAVFTQDIEDLKSQIDDTHGEGKQPQIVNKPPERTQLEIVQDTVFNLVSNMGLDKDTNIGWVTAQLEGKTNDLKTWRELKNYVSGLINTHVWNNVSNDFLIKEQAETVKPPKAESKEPEQVNEDLAETRDLVVQILNDFKLAKKDRDDYLARYTLEAKKDWVSLHKFLQAKMGSGASWNDKKKGFIIEK